MKYLKFMLLLAVALFTFGSAEAQHDAGNGRYFHNGRHYAHRSVYYKHHHKYYRYY